MPRLKSKKSFHLTEAEFAAYLIENPDVNIIQVMPLHMGITIEDLLPTKNKLGNEITHVDGYKFQSKLEARRYQVLKRWEQAEIIHSLSVQYDDKKKHTWVLQDGFRLPNGKKQRAIKYIDDFQYVQTETGLTIVEDTKGYEMPTFKNKAKMFRMRYPLVHFFINHSVTGWYTQSVKG